MERARAGRLLEALEMLERIRSRRAFRAVTTIIKERPCTGC